MNKWMRTAIAILVSLALCAVYGAVLLIYTKPFENQAYSLSMIWEAETMPEDWAYDQKGWTVFTQEGEAVTELDADGSGGFTGMESPGQTFYFSRTMAENLNCPTLRLQAEEPAVAVFLDNSLIYTDCPELDNRVGHLHLPMLEEPRSEPVLITLPREYQGKTLTIAQGSRPAWESGHAAVHPISVTLYSGYSYESSLISESFQTAVPSSLAYATGVVLLFLMVVQTVRGKPDMVTVCGALLAFCWFAGRLARTSFAGFYFSTISIDMISLCWNISLALLLAFLSSNLPRRRSIVPWILTALYGFMVLASAVLQAMGRQNLFPVQFANLAGLFGLLVVLAFSFEERKHGSWLYRCFCILTAIGILFWTFASFTSPSKNTVWQQFTMKTLGYILWNLMLPVALAALVATIVKAVRSEFARRTQERLMAQRTELAQGSYEAMRRQHEQVMMLRHNMTKHFRLLRQMATSDKAKEYLDGLLGETEKILTVVQSGNGVLDIILNSKLNEAAGAGIEVKLMRTQAPPKLPLSDTELCSLVVNLMDNALEAASAPGLAQPYIKLDLHIKNDFFTFVCENSTTPEWIGRKTAPGHGLGLEIVRQIVKRYGNLSKTEYGEDFYKVTVALPLRQPLK